MSKIETNRLYFGDNLTFLRNVEYFPNASVDLIYLDPPFNSNQVYNVIYREPTGSDSSAQVKAFKDTWKWEDDAALALHEINDHGRNAPPELVGLLNTLEEFLGHVPMFAYLTQMSIRLLELHRVLKSTGSLFLHCDPTASHYLKLILDSIFGVKNFRNEIIWHYSGWNKRLESRIESRHDVILFYRKKQGATFNYPTIPWMSKEEYVRIRKQKTYLDDEGREYVFSDAGSGKRVKRYIEDAMAYGRPIDDVLVIDKLTSGEKEALGYPTQKPVKLLRRIVEIGSNPGDVILDPFCGCGTTIDAVESLNADNPNSPRRRWVGIDLTHLAIDLIKYRLAMRFELGRGEYEVRGEPTTLNEARSLAMEDRYQFQYWALGLIGARPFGEEKKKGMDRGIDGYRSFLHGAQRTYEKCIVQVKSGRVSSPQIRDLKGAMLREKAEMAIFVTLEPETAEMRSEAASAGYYHSDIMNRDYPRIQILTIQTLLQHPDSLRIPPGGEIARIEKYQGVEGGQNGLFKPVA